MKDIQSQHDPRRINIKKVGVKDISYPITVKDKAKSRQRTVARVNMYVNLPHHFKGTHMSRFIEILNQVRGEVTLNSFQAILKRMRIKLQAEEAHMEIEFPYFLRKPSHENNSVQIREYTCKMHGSLTASDKEKLTLDVTVPIFPPLTDQRDNLLPRSLGHWGEAMISLQFRSFVWIEDIITLVEEVTRHHLSRSANEKCSPVGQQLSVEQLTEELGQKLAEHRDISWFSVRIENLSEGHSTFASLDSAVFFCYDRSRQYNTTCENER